MATIDAVIVGAGAGTRLGYSVPKAFVQLCGNPLLYYSLATYCSHRSIGRIILVVSSSMIETAEYFVNENVEFVKKTVIAAGGDERWESVRNGCSLSDSEWVLIHDAARPFVTAEVIDSVLEKRADFDCVITATPEVDTIRAIESGNRCGATLDRSKLMRVGTPQLFRREPLMSSFGQIQNMAAPPTDEAALFENLGLAVGYSWGDPLNFKITTKADLKIARALLEMNQRRGQNSDV